MKPAKTVVMAVLYCLAAFLASAPAQQSSKTPSWIGAWAASQQIPEPQNSLPPDDLRDATVRQVVHLSLGGQSLRIHLSNAFGIEPLHFTSVHIARPVAA